jgi:hypothetical protein
MKTIEKQLKEMANVKYTSSGEIRVVDFDTFLFMVTQQGAYNLIEGI